MLKKPEFDTYSVDSFESFFNLVQHVEALPVAPLVLDVETDHKSEKLAKLFGVGLSFRDDEAFYIPIRDNTKKLLWSEDQLSEIFRWVNQWIGERTIIGHNVIYDCLVWENNTGRDISQHVYSDTILQKHSLDEERPFGLKEVGLKYLGSWADKAQSALYANIAANGGSTTKDNLEMWRADTDVLAEYCCFDVLITRKLFNLFEPRLKEEGLYELFYEQEIMPLYREVTIDMKRKGFRVDVAHFEKLKREITVDIEQYEDAIMAELRDTVAEKVKELLDKAHPVSRKGNFPKVAAESYGIELPMSKDGKATLSRSGLEKCFSQATRHEDKLFLSWVLNEDQEFPFDPLLVQEKLFFAKKANESKRYVFNLNSDYHLRWLLFTKLELDPIKETDSGEPSVDAETLEEMAGLHPFCDKIIDFKKLNKLDGTYIQGILDRQIDGYLHTSFLQFGTTSGRYSSRDPNLQNLPRVKGEDSNLSPLVLKYANAIRQGFVAPLGYKIVDADYSALEPRAFAHMSGDANLQAIFHKGEDMYSSIAKRVFGLDDCSVFKKDANFLGKLYPEKRQSVKAMALAVTYGAEAGRIASLLNVPRAEAQQMIDDYLDAYPGLRDYIKGSHESAKKHGFVRTIFGRIRHLPQAKALYAKHGDKLLDYRYVKGKGLTSERGLYKNLLNNSTNMRIQALAAHIINRASIAIAREFKRQKLDAYIGLQIHDQLCCVAREDQAEQAKQIIRDCMEQTVHISVPLVAEPQIADNLRDSK